MKVLLQWVQLLLVVFFTHEAMMQNRGQVVANKDDPIIDSSVLPSVTISDEKSISHVVSILESNVEQWGFIESQLLEPNVNLGMPEIFIPLRHLTTTLEIFGTILFIQNDLLEAKATLERACPLLELLPTSPDTNEEQHAENCYQLLKKVYRKLHTGRDAANPGNPNVVDEEDDMDSMDKQLMLENIIGALSHQLQESGLGLDLHANAGANAGVAGESSGSSAFSNKATSGSGDASKDKRKKKRGKEWDDDEWDSDNNTNERFDGRSDRNFYL